MRKPEFGESVFADTATRLKVVTQLHAGAFAKADNNEEEEAANVDLAADTTAAAYAPGLVGDTLSPRSRNELTHLASGKATNSVEEHLYVASGSEDDVEAA
eukprot:SAG31_NODE_10148_length_1178_cov_0.759963_2_plen_101_part_00